MMGNPMTILTRTCDVFGKELTPDATLDRLREKPQDEKMFERMMKACVEAVIAVLERQYKKYFETDISVKLISETKSARCQYGCRGGDGHVQCSSEKGTKCYTGLFIMQNAGKNKSRDGSVP